jgi:hypothetical protein
MGQVLRWAALLTGIVLVLFCVSDIVQFAAFLHSHGFQLSWSILARNPMMPGRWGMWLFVAAVLLGNAWYSFRNSK